MNITEHRPPLKRIDFGLKPRKVEPDPVNLDLLSLYAEQERIMHLLRQSAEGCNAVGGEG
jgi:hypothetical protein